MFLGTEVSDSNAVEDPAGNLHKVWVRSWRHGDGGELRTHALSQGAASHPLDSSLPRPSQNVGLPLSYLPISYEKLMI